MKFRAHGSASYQQEGQVLIAEIVGPWNLELIHSYRKAASERIPALAANGPWALIIVLRGAAICPQDAIDSIRAGAIEHVLRWQRICTAYVIGSEVEGYKVMDRVWHSIYAGVMPFAIFESNDEALHWVQQRLLDVAAHPRLLVPDREP
ncbi:MAG: hypothetical protein CGU28_16015 [Candidatus Dactylopiibacterium carminicum]|uniref:STAS/SEC14 domain-containing protein n=1 Tax=Candidatus Dactylopiibacterium carminicum TaxID=857335 RepID=A0A272EMY1_9RHOO|nr:hypothetical protein [Candidatus Dactylopiibacterium carminicum]KAF7597876.1 hypothetical protein BGI27_16355 [Candidatus Dactylopiibacterium carminicum]PAS91465.1 MAG: hypothetical protein CGU29_16320 [Candidatus Dactylopiibacterium carminicum]PAS92878.1 MAG: hypothetical protein CGU28_16015 [Candidatus Dactylopiibacterium carminicum]PAS95823.1 MAG: hypothetical protein BSR46_16390 [Candidatus Dactylopiibacterium carminicum]